MADVDFDDFDGGYHAPQPGRYQHILNLAGAATSLALIVGLGVWGYNLAVRDVTGIPVVRAVEGPMRIAPSDPGGEIADHQGLAVNDVAAAGVATAPADRLVLAPAPVSLTEEDSAGLAPALPLEDPAAGAVADTATVPLPEPAPATDIVTDLAAVDQSDPNAVALALAEALAEGADPLAPLAEPVTDASQLSALATEAGMIEAEPAEPAPEGAMARSLRPVARPASRPAAATLAATTPETAPAAAAEVDPSSLEVGTRLVQLGAFDTTDQAREEWTKLQSRFGELLAGKSLVVQEAESGGRTFYRLRAHGFEGEDDARRFCSAMLAENAACIPVAHR